jgi:sterol desaturase/sphingolipid hydroxylase (fatty acid hydroxylase superfamily)
MTPGMEITLRIGAYAAVFALLAAWEIFAPRRERLFDRKERWPSNIGILIIDALAVRLLMPTAAVGAAVFAAEHQIGLFHWAGWPALVSAAVGFVLLDLVIYMQHVAFHKVPWLWRLHRVHHADTDVDVTTGVRFHPIEILLSMLLKIAVVLMFGIPAVSVLIFEIVLNATSMFNHSNAQMPGWLDRIVRWLVVTPDMHRVHHSIMRHETDSNYGFNLPWWDRLFRTYRASPEKGHIAMTLGLPIFRDARELRLDRLLTQPFRDETAVADKKPPVTASR